MALLASQTQLKVTTCWLLPRGSVKNCGPPQKTAEGSLSEIAEKELIRVLKRDTLILSEWEIIPAMQ